MRYVRGVRRSQVPGSADGFTGARPVTHVDPRVVERGHVERPRRAIRLDDRGQLGQQADLRVAVGPGPRTGGVTHDGDGRYPRCTGYVGDGDVATVAAVDGDDLIAAVGIGDEVAKAILYAIDEHPALSTR